MKELTVTFARDMEDKPLVDIRDDTGQIWIKDCTPEKLEMIAFRLSFLAKCTAKSKPGTHTISILDTGKP